MEPGLVEHGNSFFNPLYFCVEVQFRKIVHVIS